MVLCNSVRFDLGGAHRLDNYSVYLKISWTFAIFCGVLLCYRRWQFFCRAEKCKLCDMYRYGDIRCADGLKGDRKGLPNGSPNYKLIDPVRIIFVTFSKIATRT